jgi:tetratricopeptide (TPR) repeat protein
LTLLFSLVTASTAFSEGWYAVSSDNFTLYTDGPEDETKELIEKFESFRGSALAVLGLRDEPEKLRLLIMVYDKARDFGRISPRSAAGFYYDSIFGPRMLMRGIGGDADQGVLFHEYVHYLMNQRSTFNYPRWYAEGLATVLMTTEIEDSILVGNPPRYAAMAIELGFRPTVHGVVTGTVDAEDGFYLTGWLLSHYVSLGDRTRRQQTTDYLRRYDAGEDPVAAFEASYGITPTGMDAELAAYARRGKLNALKAPRQPYSGSLSTRALDQDEALLLLADIAVEVDALEAAHHYFEEARTTDTDSPFRAKLMARRSIAYVHERKVSEGDQLVARLLEDGSEDPQVLGDIAHYAFDKFVEIRTGRSAGDEAAELERAIEYGVRALAADPANLEARYYLGLSYEAAGRLQNAADALLSGYDLSPSPRLNLALARVLIKGGQHELASYLLSRLVNVSHADEWRSGLRAVIADIEDGTLSSDYALLSPSWAATSGDE